MLLDLVPGYWFNHLIYNVTEAFRMLHVPGIYFCLSQTEIYLLLSNCKIIIVNLNYASLFVWPAELKLAARNNTHSHDESSDKGTDNTIGCVSLYSQCQLPTVWRPYLYFLCPQVHASVQQHPSHYLSNYCSSVCFHRITQGCHLNIGQLKTYSCPN